MNALLKFTADRDAYVAANVDRVVSATWHDPSARAEAAGVAVNSARALLALSLNDATELGLAIKEGMDAAIAQIAKYRAEDEFHAMDDLEAAPIYTGPRPINPVSQEDSGE